MLHSLFVLQMQQLQLEQSHRALSGCMHATLWHVFAHMHAFVRPSVPHAQRAGRATSITVRLFIKALLPGNLVAWQHWRGARRGDAKGEKTDGKRKGRTCLLHL